jgi:hypothetical protein
VKVWSATVWTKEIVGGVVQAGVQQHLTNRRRIVFLQVKVWPTETLKEISGELGVIHGLQGFAMILVGA